MKSIDITGKKLGKLTAIRFYSRNKNGLPSWLFRCDCGTEKVYQKAQFLCGVKTDCGCSRRENIAGHKFNKLTAIRFDHIEGLHTHAKHYWLFRCDCGNETVTIKAGVLNGRIKSCGCSRKEAANKVATHGFARGKKERFYKIWKGLKQRCQNFQNPSYKHYGARGIAVCKRWHKFENFRDDMYASYLEHVGKFGKNQTTIERGNNDKGYTPKNCRWATYREQALNRRKKSHIYISSNS